mgnify:CR=1 FL=1
MKCSKIGIAGLVLLIALGMLFMWLHLRFRSQGESPAQSAIPGDERTDGRRAIEVAAVSSVLPDDFDHSFVVLNYKLVGGRDPAFLFVFEMNDKEWVEYLSRSVVLQTAELPLTLTQNFPAWSIPLDTGHLGWVSSYSELQIWVVSKMGERVRLGGLRSRRVSFLPAEVFVLFE